MPRIFYGWWITLATVAVFAIGGGFSFYSLTVYFAGFEQAYGWSRTELSGAISISFLITGLFAPFAGRTSDKRSARGVIAFGATVCAFSFVFLAFADAVWQLYAAYAIMAVGRMGLNFVPLGTVVAKWFVRRRGMAMGLMRVGAGLGGFLIAPFAEYLISSFGLSQAFLVIAIILLVTIVPLVMVVVKQSPADMGLLPDGEVADQVVLPDGLAERIERRVDQAGITMKQSLKVPTFWFLAAAIGIFFTGEVAILMHTVPYFVDKGLTTAEATRIVSLTAVMGIVGALLMGYLADNVLNSRYLMSISCALQSLSLVFLWFADSTLIIWAFAITFGLSTAGILTLQAVVVGDSFGIGSFGEIFGVLFAVTNVGTVAGPFIAGYIFDSTGSYQVALTVFLLGDLLAAFLMLLVRPLRQIVTQLDANQSLVRR